MDLSTYRALLPEGDAFNTLTSVVRLATGPEYDFEVKLVLDKAAVPDLYLGSAAGDEGPACQLGWTTWLGQEDRPADADEAVFTPSLHAEEALETLEARP
jgi:predicted component of type VI protein secretion system